MLTLFVMFSLSAAPPQLVSSGLSAVQVPEKTAQFWSDHLAEQLSQRGFKVTTSSGVAAVIGLERQRQLLGCSSELSASCLAELASALGAQALVTGSIARFGTRYQLNVEIVSSADARVLASFSEKAPSEAAMLDVLDRAAQALATQALPSFQVTAAPPKMSRAWALVPASAGLGLGVAAGVLLGLSRASWTALATQDRAVVGADPVAFASAGATQQSVGIGLACGAVVALATAAVLFFLGEPPSVAFNWVGPGALVEAAP